MTAWSSTWSPRTPSRRIETEARLTIIRAETPEDIAGVEAVTRAAFNPYPGRGEPEVTLLRLLRGEGALSLSLVTSDPGDVVAHAAFSPVRIEGATGWLGLGPVCVRPDRQRQGLGAALIEEGLDRLRSRGAGGCVVLGDPAYYQRFGFVFGGEPHYPPAPREHFGALVFRGPRPGGAVAYHPAFARG